MLNFINKYILFARLIPSFISIIPIMIIVYYFLPEILSIANMFIWWTIILLVIFIISFYCRDKGKKVEEIIFKNLGGKPSEILLRLSDERLSFEYKKKIYVFLKNHIVTDFPESLEEENSNKEKFYKSYKISNDWILNNTRDKEKFSLVHEELISYGFIRNLYGMRYFSYIVAILCLGIITFEIKFIEYPLVNWCEIIFEYTKNQFLCTIAILIYLIGMFIFNKKSRIEKYAFLYAKQLLMATFLIEKEDCFQKNK